MEWYMVIKTINGRRYRYRQKTSRQGKRVCTQSEYLCPEVIIGYHGTFAQFEHFSSDYLGSANDCDSSHEGFFASNEKVAVSYASTYLARRRGLEVTIATIKARILALTGAPSFEAKEGLEEGEFDTDLSNRTRHFLRMLDRAYTKLHDLQITKVAVSKRADVKKCILDFKNPYLHHMKGRRYDDQVFCDAIFDAKERGCDGIIFRKTYDPGSYPLDSPMTDVYVAFDPYQIRVTAPHDLAEFNTTKAIEA